MRGMKNFALMFAARLFWMTVVVSCVVSAMGIAADHLGRTDAYDGGGLSVAHVPSHAQPVQVPAVSDPIGVGERPYVAYITRRVPAGWMTKSNRAVVVANGHTACMVMSQGRTAAETVGWMMDQVHARDWDVPMYVAQVWGAKKYICGGSR